VKITVKLYAVLQIGRFEEKNFDYPVGITVRDVVGGLKLPPEHVDIFLVNGLHVDAGYLLEENDILSLLPMVEGG
jgi:sulfur carrier protein ThiS